ncbi:sigma-70 family RNA polymerase sigma factor [Paludisphaera mucosa]|uniref:Sigma-70 family RNA polymerase sigma factor n=1 Tax=Paludisphaera mucosa TaxID=3030827 RepID=A0ABT6F3T5_9BACT|nr:sigma-70 family RNA polymerase sigma factor [Paludisphaera mucosa]MDG3002250.1 sigma-70 family RNA polymerase sigma factor [Paludisphaera mucosa]
MDQALCYGRRAASLAPPDAKFGSNSAVKIREPEKGMKPAASLDILNSPEYHPMAGLGGAMGADTQGDGRGGGDARSGRPFDDWDALEGQRPFLKRAALCAGQSVLNSANDASDVVQNTLIEAKRWAESFRGRTEAEWKAWLLRLLRTQLSRLRRKPSAIAASPDHPQIHDQADSGTAPSKAAVRSERADALAKALLWLDPRDQELLRLRHEERWEFAAIAGRLGLPSPDAARKRHMRAVNQLRLILGPAHDPV